MAGQFQCPHCPFFTHLRIDYKLHLSHKHSKVGENGIVYWKCAVPQCKKQYPTLNDYIAHLRNFEGFCEWDVPEEAPKSAETEEYEAILGNYHNGK